MVSLAEEKKPKQEVTILSRTEVTTYPKLKQPLVQKVITYVAGDLPPRTIFIPVDQWSIDKEKAAIKKDIEEQAKLKPESYEV